MLALSASELTKTEASPQQMQSLALDHRVKSITALNAAIQRGVNCSEEGNAMLATCFSLLFQSTLIAEGLVEYMTFIRGTFVVSAQMLGGKLRFFFNQIAEAVRVQSFVNDFEDIPILAPRLVCSARESLTEFKSLCTTKLETDVWETLWEIAESLVVCSSRGMFSLL
jgi:hypothetical protein